MFLIKKNDGLDELANVYQDKVIVGHGSSIEGNIKVKEFVHIKGNFKGTIKTNVVQIEMGAYVSADIVAKSIANYGNLEGKIVADKMLNHGILNGNLTINNLQYKKQDNGQYQTAH